jgi:hypothetical protein
LPFESFFDFRKKPICSSQDAQPWGYSRSSLEALAVAELKFNSRMYLTSANLASGGEINFVPGCSPCAVVEDLITRGSMIKKLVLTMKKKLCRH